MKKCDLEALAHLIAERVDLGRYLENEVGLSIKWSGESGKTVCPLHGDTDPSMSVTHKEDGVWVWHCFGCKRGGTVIHFFMDYYAVGYEEAVAMICDRFSVVDPGELLLSSLDATSAPPDDIKRADASHFVAANACRILLRRDIRQSEWVAGAYRAMNLALEGHDWIALDEVYEEACKRLEGLRVGTEG